MMTEHEQFHIMPITGNEPDIAHHPEARITRSRPDDGCPLCISGRCWQRVTMTPLGETIVHGVSVQ